MPRPFIAFLALAVATQAAATSIALTPGLEDHLSPPPPGPWRAHLAQDHPGRLPDGSSARVFAPGSFWYRPLPADAPLDPDSATIVAALANQAANDYADALQSEHPAYAPATSFSLNLNRDAYTPGVFVAHDTDPVATFLYDSCRNDPRDLGPALIANHLTGVHVPPGAQPSPGSDGEMSIYNADSHRLTDVWRATRLDDAAKAARGIPASTPAYTVCWGGSIPDTRVQDTFHDSYGVTAAGLPFLGGLVTPEELRAGRIDHVIGVVLPVDRLNDHVSWPANRTDGTRPAADPTTLAEGQLLRLPPDLDVDALHLSPEARAVAHAAQEYGLVVWDGGASGLALRAINSNSYTARPYDWDYRYDWGTDTWGWYLMGDTGRGYAPFPVDRLQVVSADYGKP